MYVDHIVETPEGKVTFQGELTPAELKAVVTVGLNYLMSVGALIQMEKNKNNDVTLN